MIPVETVLGLGRGRDEREQWWGVNSSMMYLIYCKNFCKCYNALPASTIKIIINLVGHLDI
jgi:hypothetical protein